LPQAVHSDHCPVGVTLNMDIWNTSIYLTRMSVWVKFV
jgi:hypothetical protein